MKEIKLHGRIAAGRVALVDDADYAAVSRYRWHVFERQRGPGQRHAGPYAWTHVYRGGHRTTARLHTLITGYRLVDHKDHDGLNCQRSNLRDATPVLNNANQRKQISGRSSKFKGVSWSAFTGKWQAHIQSGGRRRFLGRFADESEAARAYDEAAVALWGEFARTNLGAS